MKDKKIIKKKSKMLKEMGVAAILCSASAEAAAILSTDFTGRSVSGTTASNITWVTDGVADPGNLTVTNSNLAGNGNLFSTANAAGHFAVANNTGNGGVWFTDIPVSILGGDIALMSVDLDVTNFNGSGGFQGVSRSTDFTVEVIGSASGSLGSISGAGNGIPSDSFTVTFASPITLTNTETYDFRITASKTAGSPAGNNTAIDSVVFNGTAVPEPSTLVLGLLGVFGLAVRRR
ncbi:MAG: PEP-CTERM sorting domain-containing protein [Akkermansiaceae bacterium]